MAPNQADAYEEYAHQQRHEPIERDGNEEPIIDPERDIFAGPGH